MALWSGFVPPALVAPSLGQTDGSIGAKAVYLVSEYCDKRPYFPYPC